MTDQFFNQNMMYILLGFVAIVLLAQTHILLRIRNVLQAVSMNFDSLLYCTRKMAETNTVQKSPAARSQKACQFCKHRLAYINTGERGVTGEDMYYHCGLRNVQVQLNDSCQQFEADSDAE